MGWTKYQNKSQHRKLTLEKKILLPLLQGFEPVTFWSQVQHSNHWAILKLETNEWTEMFVKLETSEWIEVGVKIDKWILCVCVCEASDKWVNCGVGVCVWSLRQMNESVSACVLRHEWTGVVCDRVQIIILFSKPSGTVCLSLYRENHSSPKSHWPAMPDVHLVFIEKRSVHYTCEKVHLIYNFILPWLELLKFCWTDRTQCVRACTRACVCKREIRRI